MQPTRKGKPKQNKMIQYNYQSLLDKDYKFIQSKKGIGWINRSIQERLER